MKLNLLCSTFLGLIITAGFTHDVAAQSAQSAQGSVATDKLFAVEIKVGPGWDSSKPAGEQRYFSEHSANLKRLRDAGHIVMGARYAAIGLVIFSASSQEVVAAFMQEDPAMAAGTFVYEVHALNVFYPWRIDANTAR